MPALAPLIIALLSIFGVNVSEDAAALLAEHLSATIGAVAALIYALSKAIQAYKARK